MNNKKKSFITNEEPISRYKEGPLTAKDTGDYLLEHMDKDSGMGKSDLEHYDTMADLGRKFMDKENRQFRKLSPSEVHLEDAGAAKVASAEEAKVAVDALMSRVKKAEGDLPPWLKNVEDTKKELGPEPAFEGKGEENGEKPTPKSPQKTLNEAEKDLKSVQKDLMDAKKTLEIINGDVTACLAGQKRFGRRYAEELNETLPSVKEVVEDVESAIQTAQDAVKDVKTVVNKEQGDKAPETKSEPEGGEKAEMNTEKAMAAVETPKSLFDKVKGWLHFGKAVEAMAKDASAFPPSKATDPGDYMLPHMDKETGMGKSDVQHWQDLSGEGRKLINQDKAKNWHDDGNAVHQDVLQGKKFQAVLKKTRLGSTLSPAEQYYIIYADGEPVYKATFANVAGENANRLDIFRKFCSDEYRDAIEVKANSGGIASVAEELQGKWLIELPRSKRAKAFDTKTNFNVIQNKPGMSSSDAEENAYRAQEFGDAEYASALNKDNKAPGRTASREVTAEELQTIKATQAVRLARLASAKGVIPFNAEMIEKCAGWYMELDNNGYDEEKAKLQSMRTVNAIAITAAEIPIADSKAGIVHNTLDALKSTKYDGTPGAEAAGTVNLSESVKGPAQIKEKNLETKMSKTNRLKKQADDIVVTLSPGDCIKVESEGSKPEGFEPKEDLAAATTTETGNPETYAARKLAQEGQDPEDMIGESDQKEKDQDKDYNYEGHQKTDESMSSGYASGGYPRHLIDKMIRGEASMEEETAPVRRKVAARENYEEEGDTLKVIPQMTKTAAQLQDTKSLEDIAAQIVNNAPSVATNLRRAGLAEDPGTNYRSQGFRLRR